MISMKLSAFLSLLKAESLQNISDDFYDSRDFVNSISRSLDYIFRSLNAENVFPYAAVEETLAETTAGNRTYTLSYKLQGIIEDYDDTQIDPDNGKGSNTGVWGDDSPLTKRNFFVEEDKGSFYTFGSSITGIRTITTSKSYTALRIRYKRGPNYPSVEDLDADIDLPEDLIGVLLNLCMWRVIPLFLENGFDLANNYYLQANEDMMNYRRVMAGAIGTDRFTG